MAEEEKKKKNKKKEKTFEVTLMDVGRPSNMAVAAISAFYIFYFPGLPYSSFGRRGIIILAVIVVGVIAVMQAVVAPITNKFIVGKISDTLEKDKTNELTRIERTELVKNLMRLPQKIGLEVNLVFLASVIVYTIVLYRFYGVIFTTAMLFFACGLFCTYVAFLAAFVYTETLCSKCTIELIKKGIDVETVQKDKFYGKNLINRLIMFVWLMAFFVCGIVFYLFVDLLNQNFQGYSTSGLYGKQMTKMVVFIIMSFGTMVMYASVMYWQISNSYREINNTLEKLLLNVEEEEAFLPTDMSNDFSNSYFLINEIIRNLHNIVAKVLNTSHNILVATENLSVTARETAETAVEEATSVKECLAAMDGLADVLTQISGRIYNVSVAAADAKFDVDDGYSLLHTEIIEKKINEITNANIDTILGIKDFSDKIGNVWNIINTIDSVAEKTKIIAFNAELEATEAGEKGETFHIIANEIRRLATTITDSTQRIKSYIQSIQEFSDNLIVTSEVGTQKIREGSTFFSSLEEKFSDLRTATDITAESAMSIQEITDTQDTAFDQISGTFKQISVGFDQFAQASQYINKVAEDLREISEKLELIKLEDEYEELENSEEENELV